MVLVEAQASMDPEFEDRRPAWSGSLRTFGRQNYERVNDEGLGSPSSCHPNMRTFLRKQYHHHPRRKNTREASLLDPKFREKHGFEQKAEIRWEFRWQSGSKE